MNIPQVSTLNLNRFSQYGMPEKQNMNCGSYNITMNKPLRADTVSFKAALPSNKTMGKLKDMVTELVAKRVHQKHVKPHNDMLKLIKKRFEDILSTENERNLITLHHRIKKNFSIRQKTTSIDVTNIENLFKEMKDVSGFAFILEDGKAFQQFTNILNKMIRNREINIVDLEYYRIPPLCKKSKIIESYDSLNTNLVNKIGATVDEVTNRTKPILDEKPSPAGYSGLHITIKHKDGTFSEWQVMTRAMHNLKEIENFFYKMKEGKSLDPKYSYIEDALSALKPMPDYATEKEIAAQKALKSKILQYTIEAYKERLKRPYVDRLDFLVPTDPELAKYDFNKIAALKELCESLH